MCIATPGKVIKIVKGKATVQYPSEQRYALIGGENVSVGDHVLVQMGIIIQVLSAGDAQMRSQSFFQGGKA